MLSYIQSKLMFIIGVLLVISLGYSSISTYLYLGTRDKLTSLQSQYRQLQSDYKVLSEEIDTLTDTITLKEALVVDLRVSLSKQEQDKSDAISKLDKIPKKCKPTTNIETPHEQVDIDLPLDTQFLDAIKLQHSSN